MKTLGYYNGKYGEAEEMSVPFTDRAAYFGDGVYDAAYSRNRKIYAQDEHLDRFFANLKLIGLPFKYDKQTLKDILCSLIQKTDDGELFVYWQASRGAAVRDHAYPDGKDANLWILMKPAKLKETDKRIKIISAADTRYSHCNIKTLNLLPNILTYNKALSVGAEEAVFHRDLKVTECSQSNIFIIKEGVVITPPESNLILPGITRKKTLEFCKIHNIPCEERNFYVGEMLSADDIFLTSAGKPAIGVSQVDFTPVGGVSDLLNVIQKGLLNDFLQKTEV